MTEVQLSGVSKRYAETEALSGIDITVADGEFFTLVGPSGCGKTTTLRTIAGFEDPTTGTVRFDGREMTGVAPEDRDVGVVFQNYALFPHMTVAENVGYGLRFREPPGDTTATERITELLDLVNLPDVADRDPSQLSGGQQQRIALARALAPNPDVLLLDEPMSALDAQLRTSLRRQLVTIQSELEITTVYVTHDQAEALAVSDRLAVMTDGQVEQIGTPAEIYRRPKTRFVAEFVGDNTILDGEVVRRDAEYTTVAVGDTQFQLPPLADEITHVAVCLRPAALSPDADTNRFPLTVNMSEFLGETVRVSGRWNEHTVVLRLAETPEEEQLTVGFEPTAAHVIEEQRRTANGDGENRRH